MTITKLYLWLEVFARYMYHVYMVTEFAFTVHCLHFSVYTRFIISIFLKSACTRIPSALGLKCIVALAFLLVCGGSYHRLSPPFSLPLPLFYLCDGWLLSFPSARRLMLMDLPPWDLSPPRSWLPIVEAP